VLSECALHGDGALEAAGAGRLPDPEVVVDGSRNRSRAAHACPGGEKNIERLVAAARFATKVEVAWLRNRAASLYRAGDDESEARINGGDADREEDNRDSALRVRIRLAEDAPDLDGDADPHCARCAPRADAGVCPRRTEGGRAERNRGADPEASHS
jgi:hypothetical protein